MQYHIAILCATVSPARDLPHYPATPCVDLIHVKRRTDSIVGGDLHLHTRFRRDDIMGMAAPLYYSAEMVRAFPDDGKRYETVHGKLLVTPAPRA